jgi:pimeloyl-ACP methyl ester carboxylesterase
MNFKIADVTGIKIFYREAGDPSKPTIVLLHGFPSSSYSFHDLIPPLADRFHVIAPDYPGMGYSEAPAPTILRPTFDDIVMAVDAFIAQCAPGPVILYMHDIGGPIGMRIATAHPERIAGLIFQNFTISVGGWNPERLKVYERLGGTETPENLAEVEQFATVDRDMFLPASGRGIREAGGAGGRGALFRRRPLRARRVCRTDRRGDHRDVLRRTPMTGYRTGSTENASNQLNRKGRWKTGNRRPRWP